MPALGKAPPRRAFLAGFMGSGKSTIGPLVAAELGWTFVDTDRMIEQRARMPVADIFQLLGETRFRTLEATVVSELCLSAPEVVVGLGGGALLGEETRERVRAAGALIFLQASVDVLVSRLSSAQGTAQRPLLSRGVSTLAELRERIAQLQAERSVIYTTIPWVVSTDGRLPMTIAAEIAAELRKMFGLPGGAA